VAGNVTNAPLNVGNNNFTITVTAEDNSKKNYYVNVIRANITNYFHIMASVEGNTGGIIKPEGEIVIGEGLSITFEMFPDNNYSIDSVFADGSYIGNLDTYTFNDVTSNHTIVVKFIHHNSIENFETRKIKIYPNPANNLVTIKSDDYINNIVVFSSDGKKVFEVKEINNKSYNLLINNLATGIYYLIVDGEIRKLIKEK